MNGEDAYERWIERERRVDPGPEFTAAVMDRVRREAAEPPVGPVATRARLLRIAAVWALAGAAGLWRAAQVLGPFLPD